ncbi:MAG: tetratricopeptide repeat protein, partial [Deltaproteobacteria bacterium]|nr:tetratricopeptide repeat protein [Deltaproteobacteria bacterium]
MSRRVPLLQKSCPALAFIAFVLAAAPLFGQGAAETPPAPAWCLEGGQDARLRRPDADAPLGVRGPSASGPGAAKAGSPGPDLGVEALGGGLEALLRKPEGHCDAARHTGATGSEADAGPEGRSSGAGTLGIETADLKIRLDSASPAPGIGMASTEASGQAIAATHVESGDDSPRAVAAKKQRAAALGARKDYAGEKELREQALASLARTKGPDHPDVLAAKSELAAVLRKLFDFKGAQELSSQVAEARQRTLGPNHPDTLVAKFEQAMDLFLLQDFKGASDAGLQA